MRVLQNPILSLRSRRSRLKQSQVASEIASSLSLGAPRNDRRKDFCSALKLLYFRYYFKCSRRATLILLIFLLGTLFIPSIVAGEEYKPGPFEYATFGSYTSDGQLSPDGNVIARITNDWQYPAPFVDFFDAETGQKINNSTRYYYDEWRGIDIWFSTNSHLAYMNEKITGENSPGRRWIVNLNTGATVHSFDATYGYQWSTKFSPDSKIISIHSHPYLVSDYYDRVKFIKTDDGSIVHNLSWPRNLYGQFTVQVDNDGKTVSGIYPDDNIYSFSAPNRTYPALGTQIGLPHPPVTVVINQIDASGFPTIHLFVSVWDANLDPISGLGSGNFFVTEEGTQQSPITVNQEAGDKPISTALALDVSGSINDNELDDINAAAVSFVNLFNAGDRGAVYKFSDDVHLIQGFTSSTGSLVSAINASRPASGRTSLMDAAYDSVAATAQEDNMRKAVVCLTDGKDNDSSHSLQDAINLAKDSHVPIFTIGLGNYLNTSKLLQLATDTGGVSYISPKIEDLQQMYEKISGALKNQYELIYTTRNTVPDGRVRTVQVRAVKGSDEGSDTATYRAPQGDIPVATIRSITPNPAGIGETVYFEGSGNDTDGTITGYNWRSSVDGQLSTESSFNTKSLSEGEHTIYFKVGDNHGLWSDEVSEVLTIKVLDTTPDTGHGKNKHDDQNAVGEPISIVNGNMYSPHQDLSIPGIGLSVDLTRTYNSQKNYNGPLGWGWTHSYNILLWQAQGRVGIMDEDGTGIYFTENADGTYAAPPGEHSSLVRAGDGAFTWTKKHGTKYLFDPNKNLKYITDRNNNQITLSYNSDGLLSAITDTANRQITLEYNSQKRLERIIDPKGRIINYSYDSQGNLVTVNDVAGGNIRYQYNDSGDVHNLTRAIGQSDNSIYYEYDSQDRCVSSYGDSDDLKVRLTFDPQNKKTTTEDSRGNKTIREYNDDGLVTKLIDPFDNAEIYAWDSDFNKTSITDKNGHAAIKTYDSRGNVLTVTDPLENRESFTYESNYDLLSSHQDADSNLTTYSYDSKGNLITLTDPYDNRTTYTYNSKGQVLTATDARPQTTTYTYDSYGNIKTITDPLGNATAFTYDELGNRTGIKNAKDAVTTFTYDTLNRVTKLTYPDDTFTSYTYDGVGNKISETDPNDNTTYYEYDVSDRLKKLTDAAGNIITYVYDTEGSLTDITDGGGNQTSYGYDDLNRLAYEINEAGITRTYEYDKVGNKSSQTDGNGNTTQYVYDAANRLEKIIYPDSSEIQYSYNKVGKRTSMVGSTGTTVYTYDKLGRLLTTDGPGAADTITYEYDKVGNRTKMTDQDEHNTTYIYDAANRLTNVTDFGSNTTTYSHDELSNLVQAVYPNGTKAIYTYNNMNRLVNLLNQTSSGNVISSFGYQYDAGGRKTRVAIPDGTVTYTYDTANRLVREVRSATQLSYSISYEYDAAGNRTKMIKDGVTTIYSCNNLNQLTKQRVEGASPRRSIVVTGTIDDLTAATVKVNGITAIVNGRNFTVEDVPLQNGANTVTAVATDSTGRSSTHEIQVTLDETAEAIYSYDDNGNLIYRSQEGAQYRYVYDYENRLTKITKNGDVIAAYSYNGEGKRVQSTEGGITTHYLYDGNNVIIERNPQGQTTASYTRGLSLGGGIGGIIARRAAGVSYYHYDALGNVTNLTNSSGSTIITYTYDAYGNVLSQSSPSTNPYQFSTKEYASETGLLYFGARYYDPSIGRFITPDPLGFIDGPNVYLYCNNNPINFIDPWGLCKEKKSISLNNLSEIIRKLAESGAINTLQEFLKNSKFGKFGGRLGPAITTVQTAFDIGKTIRDPDLNRPEKMVIEVLQIGSAIGSIQAGIYGGTKGAIIGGILTEGNPIGIAAGGVIGGTVAGGGVAVGSAYLIEKVKIYFYTH